MALGVQNSPKICNANIKFSKPLISLSIFMILFRVAAKNYPLAYSWHDHSHCILTAITPPGVRIVYITRTDHARPYSLRVTENNQPDVHGLRGDRYQLLSKFHSWIHWSVLTTIHFPAGRRILSRIHWERHFSHQHFPVHESSYDVEQSFTLQQAGMCGTLSGTASIIFQDNLSSPNQDFTETSF